jgi:23S rRNA (guanosine2251-2'-O)-methyltransferase
MPIHIKNPHSVLAALDKRPRDVQQIHLPGKAGASDAWEQVGRVAREKGIMVATGGAPRKDRHGDAGGRESAAEAVVRESSGITAEELFRGARDRAGGRGLWIALDGLQDPHNVGAIFRAAGFFGVQGILLTQERSAPLSGVAYDVASGGLEYVPFTLQTNIQRAFEIAKEEGMWILGTSEHAQDDLSSIARDRPWLLVLGNEEKGMRRLTEESCDVLCKISARGSVTSLNVSVAAGILISTLTGAE